MIRLQGLRQLRQDADLTAAKLAELAEKALPELPYVTIRPEYIIDMELGRNNNPNALMVLRIAAALGCDPKQLYIETAATAAA